MSFELEFLHLDKDGTITVIDREQWPLDHALAKIQAQHKLDEKRTAGGAITAIPIRDAAGQEVFLYADGGAVANLVLRP